MKKTTNEFSFILKPTKYGIGVFSVNKILKGTFLRLFAKETPTIKRHSRKLPKKDIPKLFQEYPIDRGKIMICPEDFGAMPIGWYLNHSHTPNERALFYFTSHKTKYPSNVAQNKFSGLV